MGVLRRLFYKDLFCLDKFDRKYPFELKSQLDCYVKTFGEKNPDKTFYIIWPEYLGAGFFANFTRVISHIKAAEHLGMIPIVDYQNFKTLYNEPEPINGTTNSWEYYFKQVSPYTLDEVYQSKRVVFCKGEGVPPATFDEKISPKVNDGFYNGESYREFIEKRVELQDAVKNELKKYDHFFDRRIVGIHFRGKEMNVAQLHPFGPTVEQMFRYTDEILEKYKIERIFLVTEEKDYLDAYIARYGDKVFYSEAFRTSKINSYNLKNARPQHRYLLGMDALVDAILLSRCTGMLYGASGLSEHASKMGDLEFIYQINNGRNFKKWYLAKYAYRIKKRLPKKFGGLLDQVSVRTREDRK